jgi:hypothetical protein
MALGLFVAPLQNIIRRVVEQVMHLIPSAVDLLDEARPAIAAAVHQRLTQLAALAGPLRGQLNVEHVADGRVAALVGDFPEALQIADGMRNRHAEQCDEPTKLRVLLQSWSSHSIPHFLVRRR